MPPEQRRNSGRSSLWRIVRWTIGAAVMAAVWFYGHFKGGTLFLISIPAGALMAVFTASALRVPVVTAALVAVAFIYGIDSGAVPALRNAATVLVAIGLVMATWNGIAWLHRREKVKKL